MNNLIKITYHLYFLFFTLYTSAENSLQYTSLKNDTLYQHAVAISSTHPDSSFVLLSSCLNNYKEKADSSNLLECLITIQEIHKINLNYSEAYTYAWEALILAEELKDSIHLAKTYEGLGALYTIFKNKKEALTYYKKALSINKTLNQKGLSTDQTLVSSFYNLVIANNGFFQHREAELYLDSCFLIANKSQISEVKKGYLYAERASIHILRQEYEEAIAILNRTITTFQNIEEKDLIYETDKGYLVLLYSFMGDAYAHSNQHTKAIDYYHKSLSAIDTYEAHKSIKGDLLFKLGELNYLKGNTNEAYQCMLQSKTFNELYFGSKSDQNKELLEIKNKHRQEIDTKNMELYEQKLQANKREKELIQIKNTLFILSLVIVVIAMLMYIYYQRKKSRLNKKLLQSKNKELTTFTLQFVEKEKLVNELTEFIKDKLPKDAANSRILKNTQKSTNNYWDEFNTRFKEVNQGFYERLSKKHPTLTSNDLKNCALIKLNFSNKEIADLLGISVNSIYMSHHRLRKKLGLERDDNLSSYIATV